VAGALLDLTLSSSGSKWGIRAKGSHALLIGNVGGQHQRDVKKKFGSRYGERGDLRNSLVERPERGKIKGGSKRFLHDS